MKKRFFAALLALAMALCLLPTVTLAAAPGVVYVGSTNVKTGYTTPQPLYNGTVQYKDNVLYLNGVTVTECADPPINASIYADGDLTIELIGSNYVTAPSDTPTGVAAVSLIVQGTGTLIATGGNMSGGFSAARSYGVHVDNDITVLSGTLTGNGGSARGISCGVHANDGNIIVSGGTLKGNGGIASGGTVTSSYGVYANDGSITVSGGTLNGTGNSATYSYGVYADNGSITVSSGTVTTMGGEYAMHAGTGTFGFSGGYATAANRLVMAGSAAPGTEWTGTDANELNGYGKTNPYKYVRITPIAAPVPKTGDSAMPLLWIAIMALAGAGLVILRKRRRA